MMTFKELAMELMDQGWRCYYLPDISSAIRNPVYLHAICRRNQIEVQVYEGKSLVFVKDSKPLEDEE